MGRCRKSQLTSVETAAGTSAGVGTPATQDRLGARPARLQGDPALSAVLLSAPLPGSHSQIRENLLCPGRGEGPLWNVPEHGGRSSRNKACPQGRLAHQRLVRRGFTGTSLTRGRETANSGPVRPRCLIKRGQEAGEARASLPVQGLGLSK